MAGLPQSLTFPRSGAIVRFVSMLVGVFVAMVIGGAGPASAMRTADVDSAGCGQEIVGGEEQVTRVEGVGPLPLGVGVVPEGVVFSRRHTRPVGEFEVGDLVLVDPEVGDLSGSAFAGFGVFGEDHVADFDVGDGLRRSIGHEYDGGAGEGAGVAEWPAWGNT